MQKHFKRLRRIEDEESDDEQGEGTADARETIATELFEGGSDHEEEEPQQRSEADVMDEDEEDDGEYSDPDDFIVDDDGNPIATKKKKRKPIFTDAYVFLKFFFNYDQLILIYE